MFKIQNIFLLIFLTTLSTQINTMSDTRSHAGPGLSITAQGKVTDETVDVQSELADGVYWGETDLIKAAIADGADVNFTSSGRIPILQLAVKRASESLEKGWPSANKWLEIVEFFLVHDSNFRQIGKNPFI